MRLSNIQNVGRIGLPIQLRTLLRETITKEPFDTINSASQYKLYPYGLYLIGAIINSRILGEAKSQNLNSMLGAGLSRIQSSLAPNVNNSIEPILKFVAPRGGGVSAVKQLVDGAAKVNGSVVDNQNWLNSLFTVFGVNDKQSRSNLTNQLRSNLGNTKPQAGTQPTPSGTQPTSQSPPQSATQPTTQRQPSLPQGNDLGGLAGTVGSEKAATIKSVNDIKAVLDAVATNRTNAAAELAKVQAKINSLMAKLATKSPPPTSTTAESVINDIAYRLLYEHEVNKNLNRIIPESVRLFGLAYGVPIVTIAEADWGKLGQTVGGFLSGVRDYLANPQYASKQFAAQQSQYDNITTAKYAVKIVLNHVQESFKAKLQQVGLNPDEVVKLYNQWNTMRKQNSASTKLADIGRKLDQVYKLFNTDQSPFIVAPPVAKQPPKVNVAVPPAARQTP